MHLLKQDEDVRPALRPFLSFRMTRSLAHLAHTSGDLSYFVCNVELATSLAGTEQVLACFQTESPPCVPLAPCVKFAAPARNRQVIGSVFAALLANSLQFLCFVGLSTEAHSSQ